MENLPCLIILLIVFGVIILVIYRIRAWNRRVTEEEEKKKTEEEAKWSNIKLGMTKQEVEEILGQPVKIREPTLLRSIDRFGPLEKWSYGWCKGNVTFRFGKLVGYRKPL